MDISFAGTYAAIAGNHGIGSGVLHMNLCVQAVTVGLTKMQNFAIFVHADGAAIDRAELAQHRPPAKARQPAVVA